jgi:hypothetical protein
VVTQVQMRPAEQGGGLVELTVTGRFFCQMVLVACLNPSWLREREGAVVTQVLLLLA